MLQRCTAFLRASHLRTLAYAVPSMMTASLQETDPELSKIIDQEQQRQKDCIIMIASENFAAHSILQCTGSVLSNKYSEGYPAARFYGGNQYIDQVENLCRSRALDAFRLNPEEWGVNVQSLSGSPANFAVYNGILEPGDRILSMDLPSGGHLSHGYQTPTKKVSATSKYFTSLPYQLDKKTGLINYKQMEELAEVYRPKLILAGASSYPRLIDYQRMKKLAMKHNSYLIADMAHIAGLVAAGLIPSPFEYCDVVTTTTHKTLRGPRGALIFFRKGVRKMDKKGKPIMWNLESKINSSVFPSLQGGPHNHTIAGIATALKQAQSPEYRFYQEQVLKNCQVLADQLIKRGYKLVSDGTDNHLVLVDLNPKGVDGARVEKVLEKCNIITNKNTIPSDTSAVVPHGLRLGTPAMTTRGLTEEDWVTVVDFMDRGVEIAKKVTEKYGKHKLAEFQGKLQADSAALSEIEDIKTKVTEFCHKFKVIN